MELESYLNGWVESKGVEMDLNSTLRSRKSFSQKMGDYFTWAKNQEKQTSQGKTPSKTISDDSVAEMPRPSWKQFENDFQEI